MNYAIELNNELYHHGIKGQKWGERNAEWYPIDEYNRAVDRGTAGTGGSSKNAKYIKKNLTRLDTKHAQRAAKYDVKLAKSESKIRENIGNEKKLSKAVSDHRLLLAEKKAEDYIHELERKKLSEYTDSEAAKERKHVASVYIKSVATTVVLASVGIISTYQPNVDMVKRQYRIGTDLQKIEAIRAAEDASKDTDKLVNKIKKNRN